VRDHHQSEVNLSTQCTASPRLAKTATRFPNQNERKEGGRKERKEGGRREGGREERASKRALQAKVLDAKSNDLSSIS